MESLSWVGIRAKEEGETEKKEEGIIKGDSMMKK